MGKKNGFTLVELLAVIAILAILVIIALPNVINMYNKARKETFLTEARTIYKEAEKKYISDSINGNTVKTINSKTNKLDLTGNKMDYDIKLDSKGKITDFKAYDGTYCISGKFNNINELDIDKVIEGNCPGSTIVSFATASWSEIINNVKSGNTSNYNLGDEKTIDLGSYGKHTVRIANKTTPSECNNSNFSQTACGFVIEFADIITEHNMNSTNTNEGGWENSEMREFLTNDIYNSLPDDLKSGIIDTKVISSHSSNDSENFITTDKIYLLASKEVYKVYETTLEDDSTYNSTRLLDGYKTAYTPSKAKYWWLRTVNGTFTEGFHGVESNGLLSSVGASNVAGVSPAFRIG